MSCYFTFHMISKKKRQKSIFEDQQWFWVSQFDKGCIALWVEWLKIELWNGWSHGAGNHEAERKQ